MSVTLSEPAAQHVAGFLAKRGKGVGIRLGVKTSGCSGLAYKLEFADDALPEDLVFESHGVKVLIDPKSLPGSIALCLGHENLSHAVHRFRHPPFPSHRKAATPMSLVWLVPWRVG